MSKPKYLTKEKTKIIIGNPGCGKTTELIRQVSEVLASGVQSFEIAFCSFTVIAVQEAKERAVKSCGLDPQDLIWFKTIHSMCYSFLGLTPEQVLSYSHYLEFAKMHGLYLGDPSAKGQIMSADDKLMRVIENASLTNMTCREYLEKEKINTWQPDYVERMAREYQVFKTAQGVFDYTDMLKRAVNIEDFSIAKFKYLFVDEAQDLSTLQWLIIDRIAEFTDNVIIAGDDKQSINAHAGADVDYFLSIDAPVQVLEQSYRVPKAAFNLVSRIVEHMHKFREEGNYWIARDEKGSVHFVRELPLEKMSSGEWLVLCRTNYILDKITAELKSLAILDNSSVRLLTIHGAKGLEADNVVFVDSTTRNIAKALYDIESDTEAKVFYVGVTRAKKNLYIVTRDMFKPNYITRYFGNDIVRLGLLM